MWQVYEKEIMLRFDFTDDELELLKKKVHFKKRQLKIIKYRRDDELTLVQMADKEHCDVSTITREIKEISIKIMKAL